MEGERNEFSHYIIQYNLITMGFRVDEIERMSSKEIDIYSTIGYQQNKDIKKQTEQLKDVNTGG
ncbi:MAG: hypothetical protein CI952_25 [Methanohalophilus sp.]|jgi:hypothetical protein|nr:MAG: hypothetical protein CI952_25 [Methanohalophilus sp.]